jgi:Biotin-requiring enzyme
MICNSIAILSRISTRNCLIPHVQLFPVRPFFHSVPSQLRIIEVVPALGESITEGSIASWSKNVGDQVAVDDVIVIVETDKVTVDIKSNNRGILIAQLASDNVSFGGSKFHQALSLTPQRKILN